ARNGAIAAVRRLVGGEDAVIMLSMLKIILGADPIARRIGVARQRLVLLVNLRGAAPNLHVRSATVERSLSEMLGFAPPATHTLRVGTWLHHRSTLSGTKGARPVRNAAHSIGRRLGSDLRSRRTCRPRGAC